MKSSDYFFVYSIKYLFTNFPNVGFQWVDYAAGGIIIGLGLWSFRVMKAFFLDVILILLSRFNFSAIDFVLDSMEEIDSGFAFFNE